MFLLVLERSGPEYDLSRPLVELPWTEHAAFMDGLVDSGFPVGGRCPRDAPPRSVEQEPPARVEGRRVDDPLDGRPRVTRPRRASDGVVFDGLFEGNA